MKGILANYEEAKVYFDTFEDINLSNDEVRVKIKATALNRADLLQKRGLYPPPEGETEILGLEMAGEVVEVGANVNNLKVGERVWSLLPGGGYADSVIIHSDSAIKIPKNLTYEEAAAIPEAFLTAYLNLKFVADLQKDEYVLIHAGASGVGTAAIQIAKQMGAKIIVTAGTKEKIKKCLELGADYAINYKEQDFQKEVLKINKNGVHVILDFIGASYWDKNATVIQKGGRWVLIGLLGEGIVKDFNLYTILAKNINLIGSTLRSKSKEFKIKLSKEFNEFSLDSFENKTMVPVIDTVFSWNDVEEAHDYMESNNNIGKVILKID